MKAVLARWLGWALFRRAHVRRLHITGCSRSGTTMLHMAMTAFRGVHFYYEESVLAFPYLADRLEALKAFRAAGIPLAERKYYVTKRDHGWFRPGMLNDLMAHVRAENMGVVLMVRDPRDVMLSSHSGRGGIDDYVTPAHWHESALAGELLREKLADEPGFLVVRYEDMVSDPEGTAARLSTVFGLTLKADSPGFRAMAHNVAHSGKAFDEYLLEAVGTVRDLDPASVGKWRRVEGDPAAPLLADPDIAPVFRRFCAAHGYMADIET
ncbi:MAG: sulfotransferase [Pacificimonas sp.]